MRQHGTAALTSVLLTLVAAVLAALTASGPPASADPTTASTSTPSSATSTSAPDARRGRIEATRQVFVRPVTTEGRPATGWTVRRMRGSVQCSGTARSAVNPGIVTCYPTAYAFAACWKSRDHTVLCVRDARSFALTRIRYDGRYPKVAAPARPAPIDLILGDRQDCTIRTGGAWGSPPQHPNWVGFYSCDDSSVYGPGRSSDGIDRRDDRWTVHTQEEPEGPLTVRGVRAAFYVGTAAA